MPARTPYWELHILPMMRLTDRDNMLWSFDLWSYDDVKTNAPNILTRVTAGKMPPAPYGGPWPDEWVSLFSRWIDAGYPRLVLGTGSYTATWSDAAGLTLNATGNYPSSGYGAWFERVATADANDYTLPFVFQPPAPPAATVLTPFTVNMPYYTAARPPFVTIVDANGSQVVNVTG
jgi:hypothetical protein